MNKWFSFFYGRPFPESSWALWENNVLSHCLMLGLLVLGTVMWPLLLLFFNKQVSAGYSYMKFYESDFLETIWTFLPIWALLCLCLHSGTVLYGISKMGRVEHPTYIPIDNFYKSSYENLLGWMQMDILLGSVKILGHQWYWEYSYTEDSVVDCWDSHLISEDEDVEGSNDVEGACPRLLNVDSPGLLPVNCWVNLLFSSGDVVHSAFFPTLGVKVDCIPGKILSQLVYIRSESQEVTGACAELCGSEHALMPIVFELCPKQKFCDYCLGARFSNNNYVGIIVNYLYLTLIFPEASMWGNNSLVMG